MGRAWVITHTKLSDICPDRSLPATKYDSDRGGHCSQGSSPSLTAQGFGGSHSHEHRLGSTGMADFSLHTLQVRFRQSEATFPNPVAGINGTTWPSAPAVQRHYYQHFPGAQATSPHRLMGLKHLSWNVQDRAPQAEVTLMP